MNLKQRIKISLSLIALVCVACLNNFKVEADSSMFSTRHYLVTSFTSLLKEPSDSAEVICKLRRNFCVQVDPANLESKNGFIKITAISRPLDTEQKLEGWISKECLAIALSGSIGESAVKLQTEDREELDLPVGTKFIVEDTFYKSHNLKISIRLAGDRGLTGILSARKCNLDFVSYSDYVEKSRAADPVDCGKPLEVEARGCTLKEMALPKASPDALEAPQPPVTSSPSVTAPARCSTTPIAPAVPTLQKPISAPVGLDKALSSPSLGSLPANSIPEKMSDHRLPETSSNLPLGLALSGIIIVSGFFTCLSLRQRRFV